MPQIKLYNSLAREKQDFTPIDESHVRLYACGPTVYNYAHIGNARMAVVFDLLTRVLKGVYPNVTYASNITDVDDKIMAASRETGEAISDITEKYTDIYNADMAALGCAEPDIQPKATAHIGDMIDIIQELIDRGHAYEPEPADGHVLFHVPSFPAYGGLSGRNRDEQIAGARVDVASYKRDPADFVLWKPSNEGEVGWESPFGPNKGYGRPGWHIECSAMSAVHLGLPFDIHGGGADLKFPHHENEIAQSCCASGHTDDLSAFSKYWVHNGFVTVEGEKMSKSLGNVVLAHDLLEQGVNGHVVRLALLSAQYRRPLDWSAQSLHQAEALYKKLQKALADLDMNADGFDGSAMDVAFFTALCDDLNTPLAFARLNAMVGEANKAADERDRQQHLNVLYNAVTLLGVDVSADEVGAQDDADVAAIELLIAERLEAKDNKDYARADDIRGELTAMGVEIEDHAEGTRWSKV